ncbi:MAG: dienelactone hydrolase family protein, partial [Planctomycetota bacterium]
MNFGTTILALLCVAFLTFSELAVFAEDVPWLSNVNQPPIVVPDQSAGRFTDLLRLENGQRISTVDGWKQQRVVLRQAWREFLGPMPETRPEVRLELLSTEVIGQVTRQLIRYEGEPDLFVEAFLLLPSPFEGEPAEFRTEAPLPAIIALHPTTDVSIDEIAGVSGRDEMHSGLKLAQAGYVVLCPRCFLWQNAASLNDAVEQHRQRHRGTLGMAKMLYDAMRSVDILESLPSVDKTRIGAFGHSLGAKEVLYLAAFDERITASVASEGGLGYRSTNWSAPWYLGTAIDEAEFPLNHHQLIAMIAPRPFLVLGGESGPGAADGDRSWTILNPARDVWELYDPV